MYKIMDYFENPFGQCLHITNDYNEAKSLVEALENDPEIEVNLKIVETKH